METMTLKEKVAFAMKSIELKKAGRLEEAERMWKEHIPLSPHMAKWCKEMLGAEALLQMGYDLSEAEAKYGKDWLRR